MLSLFFEFENKAYRYYLNRISTRDKVISRETNELNQICTASRSSHLKRIVPSYEIPYRRSNLFISNLSRLRIHHHRLPNIFLAICTFPSKNNNYHNYTRSTSISKLLNYTVHRGFRSLNFYKRVPRET